MGQRAWPFRIMAVAAAVSVIATPALAEMTVKGDQAAWAEVAAAYKKLNTLSAYRMKMTSPQGAQSVMEVVPPDRLRMTGEMPGGKGTVEMIKVGNQTGFRISTPGAPSKWRCGAAGPPAFVPKDPSSLEGTVDISRGPDTVLEGTPVHTYTYTVTATGRPQGAAPKTTLYVAAQTGLPRRSVIEVAGGQQTIVDYYDYGAPITIAPPPCG